MSEIEKDKHVTKVVFRKYKKEGDIIALLIEQPYSNPPHPDRIMCYQHVGQHGEAYYSYCMEITVPAKPKEYASLKREMEQLGYKFKVVNKRNRYTRETK